MLAARLDQTQPLSLIFLVLSLIRANQAIPGRLGSHFVAVLQQASQLARNPSQHRGAVYPEAVDLAVLLRSNKDLLEEIEGVHELSGIGAEQANRVLHKIESYPAT